VNVISTGATCAPGGAGGEGKESGRRRPGANALVTTTVGAEIPVRSLDPSMHNVLSFGAVS